MGGAMGTVLAFGVVGFQLMATK
jgi:hypothetical protein